MVFVVLGTQDKEFSRLLEAVDREIENGTIRDEVIVQAGQTHYESKNMKIFDLLSDPEFEKMLDRADLIITHGGAGTILSAIKKGKKVIAAPRLQKYKEHHNDHQKQIIEEFSKQGFIMELRDFNKLGKLIEKSSSFQPKKFESNTQNMIKLLENYIENTNHVSWFNRSSIALFYIFFWGFVNIIFFMIYQLMNLPIYIQNGMACFSMILLAFIVNRGRKKQYSHSLNLMFIIFQFFFFILDMVFFLCFSHFWGSVLIAKIISSTVILILNYFISKIFIFQKS